MRFTRLIPVLAMPMLAVGCDQNDPIAPDPPQLGVQAASAPIGFQVLEEFEDVNACTGLDHIVTVTGAGWVQPHQNNEVLRTKTTVTTSDGFEGRMHTTEVMNFNGGTYREVINQILKHPSGAMIRVHFVIVLDFKDWPPTVTVRVEGLEVTCVRP